MNDRNQRRAEDSRLAAPWKRRHSSAIPEKGWDPYATKGALPDPSLCSECGALFTGGRWTWGEAGEKSNSVVCPACQRIRDGYPAGFVSVRGEFLAAHREEITHLIRNREASESREHPLNRIGSWEESPEGIELTTTDTHLPRRIGEALKDAYGGELDFRYTEDEGIIRVSWTR